MLRTVQNLVAEAAGGIQRISHQQARDLEGALLIDVREVAEATNSPVAGSINIPRGVLEMKIAELSRDPQTPICVHCASGARAVLAAEQLIRLGYTHVRAIDPGLD